MPQIDPRHEQSVGKILAARARATPDNIFIHADARHLTFGEAESESNIVANATRSLGMEPGGTVLVMLPNVIEFILIWLGLGKSGAVQVPVNTAYRGNLLVHVINDSAASFLIVDCEFLQRIAEVSGELEHLETLIVRNLPEEPGLLPNGLESFRIIDLSTLFNGRDTPLAELPKHYDLKAIMYTSGTTGPSKGVMTVQAHAYAYAHGNLELMELKPGDIYYAPLPLFHIAGQWAVCYASLIAGSAAVVTERFSVQRFWQDARRFNAKVTFLLGAMANFLARQPPQPDDSVTPIERALVVPMFPDVSDFGRRFNMKIKTTYGSTETCAPHRIGWDDPDWQTCGTLHDELFEGRIVDENDEEVPDGTVGEFVIRGKEPWVLMAGYWRHPEWTEKAWSNLWLHSGDAMRRDANGRYYFVDRLTDSIRRRGENISSLEVENEINQHPAIVESAVFPISSEDTEDDVMATLVCKEGCAATPVEIIEFLEPRMARFMLPRFIDFIDALPKTPTGKIRKFSLRKKGVSSTTWDRENPS